MKKPENILVVEDSALLRQLLCVLLQDRGFNARACEDGISALDSTLEEHFHVIITDYRLPGIVNGVDLTKIMRKKFPASIIIGVSAQDRREDFLAAGADAFFLKPYQYRDILLLIRTKSGAGFRPLMIGGRAPA